MRRSPAVVPVLLICSLLTAVACRQANPPAPTTSSAPPTTRLTPTSVPATRPPTTAPPAGAGNGGLAWITGANGANGIFDQASVDAWSRFSGRKVQVAMVATNRANWASITGRNGGWSQTCGGDALNCYPGDAFVDIVSIDYYDQWPPSKTDAEFTARAEAKGGITWIWNFAVAHGKRFGVGEWGVVSTGDNPGGDNPVFIENMQRWFRDHVGRTRDRWLYEAYFNIAHEVGSALVNPTTNPKAAKAYVDCRYCH